MTLCLKASAISSLDIIIDTYGECGSYMVGYFFFYMSPLSQILTLGLSTFLSWSSLILLTYVVHTTISLGCVCFMLFRSPLPLMVLSSFLSALIHPILRGVILPNNMHDIYLTGRFPTTYLSENKYILILYDYSSNSVLPVPMRNRVDKEMLRAFDVGHHFSIP
jgi:hypothetical protein